MKHRALFNSHKRQADTSKMTEAGPIKNDTHINPNNPFSFLFSVLINMPLFCKWLLFIALTQE